MSVLLFIVGAITLILGVGAIGFGIPINEFSFGNTLIVAGMTAAAGGLIVIAIGAVVGQLHRISETLAAGADARTVSVPGAFEAPIAGRVPAGRMPLTARARPEAAVGPPVGPAPGPETAGDLPSLSAEPVLPNPDATPLTAEDLARVTIPHGTTTAQPAGDAFAPPSFGRGSSPAKGVYTPATGTAQEQGWQPPQPSTEPRPRANDFDAMWPPPRAKSPPAGPPGRPRESARDTVPAAPPAEPGPVAAETTAQAVENAPRAVAILKSGVVDGMNYTLYVDGSIEAELPQGTLRFASINDLRSHLEKNP